MHQKFEEEKKALGYGHMPWAQFLKIDLLDDNLEIAGRSKIIDLISRHSEWIQQTAQTASLKFHQQRIADDSIFINSSQNPQAECDVLGAILADESPKTYAIACEILTHEDFFVEAHKHIFYYMGRLSVKSMRIDLTSLVDELTKTGVLDRAGGPAYVAGLMSGNFNGISLIQQHATIVKEKSILRSLISAANHILTLCKAPGAYSIDELIDKAQKTILSVSHRSKTDPQPLSTVISQYFAQAALKKDKDGFTGCPTSFAKLDRLTSGFQGSDLIILAARPSMGKTALALNMLRNATLRDKCTAFFSLEMSAFQCAIRLLSTHTGVRATLIRDKSYGSDDAHVLVTKSTSLLSAGKAWIDDTSGMGIHELINKARKLHKEQNLDLLIIDYLQLIRSKDYFESKNVEIGALTRQLKELARELNIPIICLSQLNRALEVRTEKRPQLSDLRDSGAIEQDADIILFLYNQSVYDKEAYIDRAELIMAKHRNGSTDTIQLHWDRDYLSFTEEGE